MKTFSEILYEIKKYAARMKGSKMSRGIFHPAQYGNILLHNEELYEVKETGIIEDWVVFKKGKTVVLPKDQTTDPKYFTRIYGNRRSIYLCGSRAQTSPNAFPNTGWPTKDKTKTLNLKPQSFKGITDKWMKIPEFKAKLFKAIEARGDLSAENKEYLKSSIQHYINGAEITNYDSIKSNRNTVLNDYGEILGVLWFMGIHSAYDGQLFLPGSGSYPLIDSIVKTRDGEYQISSKRKGISNTIKGGDISGIIDSLNSKRQQEIRSKYKDELALLDIIQDNTVVIGTVKAFNYLMPSMYQKHKKEIDLIIKDKSFNKLLKGGSDPALIDGLQSIVSNVRVKKKFASRADVLFFMSKYIEDYSKKMNYADLANSVLSGYVVYIMAKDISDTGEITFQKIDTASSFKGAYLRYKGSRERASDRLGLQLT